MTPSQRIRLWRESLGRTQASVADAIGWRRSKLCRVELGHQDASASELEAIVQEFGLTMAEFYASAPGADAA